MKKKNSRHAKASNGAFDPELVKVIRAAEKIVDKKLKRQARKKKKK